MVLSRRQVAVFLADGLTTKRTENVRLAAAWLVARKRQSQLSLLVRDVASIMAERGYVTADVTSAQAISATLERDITDYIKATTNAREVELQAQLDPAVIGGLKLSLPDTELDATIKTKLHRFVTEMSQ